MSGKKKKKKKFSFIYEAFIAVLTSPSSAPWAFCPFFNYSTYSASVELLSFPFYLPLVPSSELLEGRDPPGYPTDMERRELLAGASPCGYPSAIKTKFRPFKTRLSGVMS